MQYIVVRESDTVILENKINDLLNKGWELVGNAQMIGNSYMGLYFCQTMIKHTEVQNKKEKD